jgi:hypothetical protein
MASEMDIPVLIELLRLYRFFSCFSAEMDIALGNREKLADGQNLVARRREPRERETAFG